MSNAPSNYLRSGNAARGSKGAPAIEETAILGAIAEHGATSVLRIAEVLGAAPPEIAETLTQMERKNLVSDRDGEVSLSVAGERALRYSRMS